MDHNGGTIFLLPQAVTVCNSVSTGPLSMLGVAQPVTPAVNPLAPPPSPSHGAERVSKGRWQPRSMDEQGDQLGPRQTDGEPGDSPRLRCCSQQHSLVDDRIHLL
jgi:hypothetical protein